MEAGNDSVACAPADAALDFALLESSFSMIAPHAEEFVDAFYAKLFELYPQTREFFDAAKACPALAILVTDVDKGDAVYPES